MGKLFEIIPITDLRQDAAKVLKQVGASSEPLVITQRGRSAAVMMGVQTYERVQREKELLHSLVRGDMEIAAGKGYALDEVIGEANKLLDLGRQS